MLKFMRFFLEEVESSEGEEYLEVDMKLEYLGKKVQFVEALVTYIIFFVIEMVVFYLDNKII